MLNKQTIAEHTENEAILASLLPRHVTTQVYRALMESVAGEYGARRIYEGQLAVLPPGPARSAVEHMAAQEKKHLEVFDVAVGERGHVLLSDDQGGSWRQARSVERSSSVRA